MSNDKNDKNQAAKNEVPSTPAETAIATVGDAMSLIAALAEDSALYNEFAEEVQETTENIRWSFPRIEIIKEIAQFAILNPKTGEPVTVKEFTGTIVFTSLFNVFWGGEQAAEKQLPVCFAPDAITPSGGTKPQHNLCKGCPKNEFYTSSDGRAKKDCRNRRRLIIAVDAPTGIDSQELMLELELPTTSLTSYNSFYQKTRQYISPDRHDAQGKLIRGKAMPLPHTAVKCQFSARKESKGAQAYSVVEIKMLGVVGIDAYTYYANCRKTFAALYAEARGELVNTTVCDETGAASHCGETCYGAADMGGGANEPYASIPEEEMPF